MQEADHRALLSNQRACTAMASGKLKEEIVPVTLVGRKGETVLFLMWPVYMEFTS
jgi:acetyl-CoA acetyltransferase